MLLQRAHADEALCLPPSRLSQPSGSRHQPIEDRVGAQPVDLANVIRKTPLRLLLSDFEQ